MARSGQQQTAARINRAVLVRLEKRAAAADGVLGPCLEEYKSQVGDSPSDPLILLHNLTRPLLEAFPRTRDSIVERFTKRWADSPDVAAMVNRSVPNSLKRSAGTNYQALVSYALARYLIAIDSAWYLVHPVPTDFRTALAITFTAGIAPATPAPELPTAEELDSANPTESFEADTEPEDSAAYTIQPDVDILLRNSGWSEERTTPEPVVLLSIKTSLVDRAGRAMEDVFRPSDASLRFSR